MMFIMTNIYYICLLYMFVACYVDLRLSADDWWLATLYMRNTERMMDAMEKAPAMICPTVNAFKSILRD